MVLFSYHIYLVDVFVERKTWHVCLAGNLRSGLEGITFCSHYRKYCDDCAHTGWWYGSISVFCSTNFTALWNVRKHRPCLWRHSLGRPVLSNAIEWIRCPPIVSL